MTMNIAESQRRSRDISPVNCYNGLGSMHGLSQRGFVLPFDYRYCALGILV